LSFRYSAVLHFLAYFKNKKEEIMGVDTDTDTDTVE
jgi:hypothetical protein